jgi:uncharacterized protein (TIGR02118 family)
MVKVVVWGNRKPGMSREEFVRWAREEHAAFPTKTPGVRSYVQHVAVEDGAPEPPICDWLTEFTFDSLEARDAAFASPESQAGLAHAATGIDLTSIRSVTVEAVYAWP